MSSVSGYLDETNTRDSAELPGSDSNPVESRPGIIAGSFHADMSWAWLALIACLMLTFIAYYTVDEESKRGAEGKFASRSAEISEAIKRRFAAYAQVLYGGLGFFRADGKVDRNQWRTYVETLDINRLFPGIQGIGYSELVTPDRKAAYEAAIRREGFPDFRIRPEGKRTLYSSITYLEPFDRRNREAFGYDMYSQETRRAAMDKARDTGLPTISGKVRLVQEINEDVQAGFLMYVPYYGQQATPETVEARRAAGIGFVYSPFRMRNLMEGILGPGIPDVRLRVYDGNGATPGNLMYDSDPKSSQATPVFGKTIRLPIGQHTWTLEVESLPSFEEYLDPQKSAMLLAGGILTSILFFFVIGSYASTRRRAEQLATKMTAAIERHAEELERSNEELARFAYVASHDLKAPLRGIDHLASWITEDLGDKLSGEPAEHMSMLRARIRRLEALLDDLLTYSRAGRQEIPLVEISLNETIPGLFDLLNIGNKFKLDYQSDTDLVTVRRSEFEQVFTNLFSNAFKYHDAEDGTISVSVNKNAGQLHFIVEDDGPGVPEEHRERIFQMFQRLQSRDEVEGSGMGLAIIRKIIQRNGGDIRVTDRIDGERGASFRFNWASNEKGADG